MVQTTWKILGKIGGKIGGKIIEKIDNKVRKIRKEIKKTKGDNDNDVLLWRWFLCLPDQFTDISVNPWFSFTAPSIEQPVYVEQNSYTPSNTGQSVNSPIYM